MNLGKYNFLKWHKRDDLSLWLIGKTLVLTMLVVALITYVLGFAFYILG